MNEEEIRDSRQRIITRHMETDEAALQSSKSKLETDILTAEETAALKEEIQELETLQAHRREKLKRLTNQP